MDRSNKQIVFGGGCFWCTEAVFKNLKGIHRVVPGYTGGTTKNPGYREVCSGRTGHNEVVQLEYDPSEIGIEQLLDVFFTSHDPTTLNRQGNDVGTQYRSGIYFTEEDQKKAVEEYIQTRGTEMWRDPIVTEVLPLEEFYPAEEYHHNYFERNPEQGYCQVIINPKIQKLKKNYSKLLKDE